MNETAIARPLTIKPAFPRVNALLGGILRRESEMHRRAALLEADSNTWRRQCGARELFLQVRGDAWPTASDADTAVLIRGYAVPRGSDDPSSQKTFAAQLFHSFRITGELSMEGVEGSFTVVALDARSQKVKLYRNLVGTGYTYYWQLGDELLFSSSLPMLLQVLASTPPVNRDVLPVLFMYRFPIGRPTLFQGILRLMPGESLEFENERLSIKQRQTLVDLEDEPIATAEAVERLELTMAEVMRDCAAVDQRAAVLLSGGVDSSYIQAHWNNVCRGNGFKPVSSVVAVDHLMTRGDREYARSAAATFGTEHLEIQANEPFGQCMTKTIAATGEVLSHAQTAYFCGFASELRNRGIRTGLCGEGADGLFGTDWITIFRRMERLRRVPQWLSRLLYALAKISGRTCWAEALELPTIVKHHLDPRHPMNRIATFAHIPAVRDAFGQEGLVQALEFRQAFLAQYKVRNDVLERVHAIGFLGESMETASLWNSCFEARGLNMLNPFLDSRILRYVMNVDPAYRFATGPPKRALRDALLRHAPSELVYRRKLAFGQPIFEYLANGGPLSSLVDQIANYDFVPRNSLFHSKQSPNWFLFTLLCFDLWHKIHIERINVAT